MGKFWTIFTWIWGWPESRSGVRSENNSTCRIIVFSGSLYKCIECHLKIFFVLQPFLHPMVLLVTRSAGRQDDRYKHLIGRDVLVPIQGPTLSGGMIPTWRIIPLSKSLITMCTIYKLFRPFGRGTTLLRGLTNHEYEPLINWDDPPSRDPITFWVYTMEPKIYAFRRWLDTPIIIWEHDDWCLGVIATVFFVHPFVNEVVRYVYTLVN